MTLYANFNIEIKFFPPIIDLCASTLITFYIQTLCNDDDGGACCG